ncbi:hypothetical protein [Streptomyces sp. NPDC049879]|uniref:hypothetical protein n=1 Tax=Streptomyces sp. NPDC049879 TaxID=3365598 RepID=UPI003798CE96
MTHQTPATAASHARAASEAIRALNHLTQRPDENAEWFYPGDAYAVVGALAELAARLPQAIGQAHRLIHTLAQGGGLRHDTGDPAALAADLSALHGAVEWARDNADLLRTSLDDVHAMLGHLGYDEDGMGEER